MLDKDQNPKELNKIIATIVDKQGVFSDENKETNHVQIEEKMYLQLNLLKLKDLDAIPLEELRDQFRKMVAKIEINELVNELGIDEFNPIQLIL